jgi:hypothetical protein
MGGNDDGRREGGHRNGMECKPDAGQKSYCTMKRTERGG